VLPATGGVLSGDTYLAGDNFDGSLYPEDCGYSYSPSGHDEIWEFQVDTDGRWTFDTCTIPARWDTSLGIAEDVGIGCPGVGLICNDDDPCGTYRESAIRDACLNAGQTYWLIVDGWSPATYFAGTYYDVTYARTGHPCGDGSGCGHQFIAGVLAPSGGTLSSDTTLGTNNFNSPCTGAIDGSGNDQIWEFQVGANGLWTFDTCTVPAAWDTTLELYKDTGAGCPGSPMVCDDDGCNVVYYESMIADVCLQTGTTYWLVVDGWSPYASGAYTVTYSQTGSLCEGAGACCNTDGSCADSVLEDKCAAGGGRYLGHGFVCDGDPDGDGVIGCDDVCPDAAAPGGVDASGRSLGDFDEDCDVDLFDFVITQLNFTGP
jgi:hypothetical protein